MDGPSFPYHCKDRPQVMQCHICAPMSPIHAFALDAIQDPLRPLVHHPVSHISQAPPAMDVQDYTMHGLSQDSHALFAAVPKITLEMAREMAIMENRLVHFQSSKEVQHKYQVPKPMVILLYCSHHCI
jgi:hypothetical protein